MRPTETPLYIIILITGRLDTDTRKLPKVHLYRDDSLTYSVTVGQETANILWPTVILVAPAIAVKCERLLSLPILNRTLQ